ncbi:transposase family protein [Bacillus sp. WMMC1349]|nr:transposase family protein [Bacillus sp. WMMC1349]
MNEQGLISAYTVAQLKPHKEKPNDSTQANELTVVVSDLTYVRVQKKWHYICVFVDLYNREMIGFSTGENKDALLVYRALSSIKGNLHRIQLFHTDRGKEFKNIKRSLSMKGCPYDNAVAESHIQDY